MRITINNIPKVIDDIEMNVADLLLMMGIKDNGTAIAVNERLIKKNDRLTTKIMDGDDITIITAAFGG